MSIIMSLLYNTSIHLLNAAIGIASLFSKKIKLMADGRRNLIKKIEYENFGDTRHTVWVHCASLGEFEQGRSIIETIRATEPDTKIVLTFFSPSGYEIRKNYQGAHQIYYLPSDTPSNARRFVKAINPQIAIFVKYEYWYNYLYQLHKSGAKSYVVSAIFRPKMRFFRNGGQFFRKMLSLIDHFFVQNEESFKLLSSISLGEKATITGDTRFDRVSDIVSKAPHLPIIEQFAANSQVIICGSTWASDIDILLPLMGDYPNHKFIIAPHEINESEIERLITLSERPTTRYTQKANPDATLMVIDCIGILSGVYAYGQMAYIGGGFGAGIHNILEAATWGLPVIFGPRYHKFAEAVELTQLGAAFAVLTYPELSTAVDNINTNREKLSEIASQYVKSHTGATSKILMHINQQQKK